jgi:signal transduction histidine kinase
MIRSLRWRLVLVMILIIAAAIAASGVYSSLTVKREFARFLVARVHSRTGDAMAMIRAVPPGQLADALRRVHTEFGLPTIVTNDGNEVIAAYPPEMRSYDVDVRGDLAYFTRIHEGRYELKKLRRQHGQSISGAGTVWIFPPGDRITQAPDEAFRGRIDRWLMAGLGGAALVAVLVMLTIFRRLFAPIEALTAGARALAGGRLDARVDVRGHDEIAELARAFNSMASSLEKNERARRNMVTDVAHELRTPLTNIRVQVEAVQDGLAVADSKFLASVEEEVLGLSRLVDDLQQLSLAEAGQIRLEIEDVSVAELVQRAISGLVTNDIAIRHDVPPALMVRADARRLVHALRNLVLNAIAYARSEVRITAAATASGSEIRVADDGPGVAPEHAERIFDRFYRADPSRSRSTGGAGVGLAIVKELTELHGGTVRYERPEFIIALPS